VFVTLKKRKTPYFIVVDDDWRENKAVFRAKKNLSKSAFILFCKDGFPLNQIWAKYAKISREMPI